MPADDVDVSERCVMRLGLQVLGKLHTGLSCCGGKALLLLESVDGVTLRGTVQKLLENKEKRVSPSSFYCPTVSL